MTQRHEGGKRRKIKSRILFREIKSNGQLEANWNRLYNGSQDIYIPFGSFYRIRRHWDKIPHSIRKRCFTILDRVIFHLVGWVTEAPSPLRSVELRVTEIGDW